MDSPRQGFFFSSFFLFFLPWLLKLAQDRCQTCRGKGDFCEYCNKEELIFVFEFAKVARCPRCRGCFHQACADAAKLTADPRNCPRCQRIQLVKGQVPVAPHQQSMYRSIGRSVKNWEPEELDVPSVSQLSTSYDRIVWP